MARSRPEPVPGRHPIDTGVAELTRDTLTGGWLVTINGAQSSHIHPDPTILDFEYMRQMAAVIASRYDGDGPLRVLHLGAAACALPRYLAARYPASRQVAVEIDGELARLAREWFDLPRAPLLRIRVGDAREVVTTLTEQTRDVVIRDAFVAARTPRHLTTHEFLTAVHRVLAPGGLYLANCGDNRDLALARAEVTTAAAVFAHVALVADAAMLKGRRTGNIVLVAADTPIEDSPALVRTLLSDPQPAQILTGRRARDFGSGVVTHDDAPG
ncbi:spermidine synthase [Gordonia insulae]|uniref:Polyamine aminopropyltransferase n=1 Tax=Gordonia insulae TaxID=2420509 RepID=A0A3G8JFB3_9ACTN|nr:fused MFS/spermidine synthase [Gordonia insulae]AZG43608.1 Polyamine aminopropyltransferase [Gordonia insulae]